MVVATVVMWGMIWWWCGSDLMGLNASRSWLFCIGGASATILMGLGGVVDGSDGTVGCWWVLVVGLLNGSQWCFSAEVGGSAHGSRSGFGFVILVGCFSFSFSGCWWWWGCGFGFVILVGCFSFSACWWWWGCGFGIVILVVGQKRTQDFKSGVAGDKWKKKLNTYPYSINKLSIKTNTQKSLFLNMKYY